MAKKLYRERLEFIRWLATPDTDRDVSTQRSFAEKYGVDEATLSHWRHEPAIIAEVNKLVDEHLADDYRDIIESFKDRARKGSYLHQKTYLEMLGKYVPRQTVEMSGGINLYLPAKGSLDDQDSHNRE